MLAESEDDLICDFAETYHILDIWALPVETLAVLASGLRDNSRIKMRLAGIEHIPAEFVLPRIADILSLYLYSFSKDAKNRRNEPKLFTDIMAGKHKKEKEITGYASGAEFMAARERIINGG
jgi:hypothetical protein